MNLPETLSRKAIMRTFSRLEPVKWESLFEREMKNGLWKHRVLSTPKCDYVHKVYYITEGVQGWLIREGYYTADEFFANARFGGQRLSATA